MEISNPSKKLITFDEEPRSSEFVASWVREQHPNLTPTVTTPFNRRAALHLNRAKFSIGCADHQVLTRYVGFWPIHSVTGTNKDGGRLSPICGFDLVGGQRAGILPWPSSSVGRKVTSTSF